MNLKHLLFATVLTAQVSYAAENAADAQKSWPQWRGPAATGVATSAHPPTTWSDTQNVKWKSAIPGYGTSTPIIWGDRVFLLTAIPTGKKQGSNPADQATSEKSDEIYQFVVLCLDRKTGKTVWQKIAREEVPHEGHHKDHGYASASPVTDGQLLFAYFGSRGLHCYDMDGNLKWEKDFGHMRTKMGFGEGASPALSGNTIIINWDHEGDDFIVALDKRTGKELWRQPRNEGTGWSTPLVVEFDGKAQVVVNASGKVRSYNVADGKQVWECGGQTANAIPSPVASKDTVYLTSGFRGSALQAIKLGRTGDLTDTDAIRWSHNKNTPYVPTPLLIDDLLYVVSGNNGIISCFDARTGQPHFEGERLEGIYGIYASPVAARDNIYILGRDGKCVVLKKGPKLEIIATNKVEGNTDASLALVENEIFLRTHESLYCISEK